MVQSASANNIILKNQNRTSEANSSFTSWSATTEYIGHVSFSNNHNYKSLLSFIYNIKRSEKWEDKLTGQRKANNACFSDNTKQF